MLQCPPAPPIRHDDPRAQNDSRPSVWFPKKIADTPSIRERRFSETSSQWGVHRPSQPKIDQRRTRATRRRRRRRRGIPERHVTKPSTEWAVNLRQRSSVFREGQISQHTPTPFPAVRYHKVHPSSFHTPPRRKQLGGAVSQSDVALKTGAPCTHALPGGILCVASK